ncbi:MAG: hypothetical protein KDA83_12830 [Planctomycetales bacterium]|nr:hypothetical protein [Planctomycetales bacterium]
MGQTNFYVNPCPTCGRRLEIAARHLGHPVECPHCTSRFLAGQGMSDERTSAVEQALLRADQYLATLAELQEVAADWERGQSVSD